MRDAGRRDSGGIKDVDFQAQSIYKLLDVEGIHRCGIVQRGKKQTIFPVMQDLAQRMIGPIRASSTSWQILELASVAARSLKEGGKGV